MVVRVRQAPELFTKSPHTEKVDVYSYGVILYQMVTGKEPWSHVEQDAPPHAARLPSLWLSIQRAAPVGQRPTLLDDLPCDAHPLVLDLMTRCLAEEPANRPSFQEVVQLLSGLQQVGIKQSAGAAIASAAAEGP